jgi:pentatricopeptide repeat protein
VFHCAVFGWLGVLAWHRPLTVRRNASKGFLPSVGLSSPFCQVVLHSGNLLGPTRFCHATAGMSDRRTDVYVNEVLKVLKSTNADNADLRGALRRFAVHMDDDIILMVLQKQRSNWQVALAFFNWAATLPGYAHGSRAYTKMLDILGRMKKVKHMRQLFDEIPEERRLVVMTHDE